MDLLPILFFGGPVVVSAAAVGAVALDRFRQRTAAVLGLIGGAVPWLLFWLAESSTSPLAFWIAVLGALVNCLALALAAIAYLASSEERRRYWPAGACLLGLLGGGCWWLWLVWMLLHAGFD
ncbi:MAG TPA: hypothetical protein VGO11_11010 [Chthoniobacteraceae bacterium]|jgi:hypothetical protein|nr:hypothetical protein [Chthoniobacteraceae bacterium]